MEKYNKEPAPKKARTRTKTEADATDDEDKVPVLRSGDSVAAVVVPPDVAAVVADAVVADVPAVAAPLTTRPPCKVLVTKGLRMGQPCGQPMRCRTVSHRICAAGPPSARAPLDLPDAAPFGGAVAETEGEPVGGAPDVVNAARADEETDL